MKLILTIILSCLLFTACGHGEKLEQGKVIIAKIEKFKSEKGRLPKGLVEIGVDETEDGQIYYEKKSESRYILWFGTTLGESVTYDSETGKWE